MSYFTIQMHGTPQKPPSVPLPAPIVTIPLHTCTCHPWTPLSSFLGYPQKLLPKKNVGACFYDHMELRLDPTTNWVNIVHGKRLTSFGRTCYVGSAAHGYAKIQLEEAHTFAGTTPRLRSNICTALSSMLKQIDRSTLKAFLQWQGSWFQIARITMETSYAPPLPLPLKRPREEDASTPLASKKEKETLPQVPQILIFTKGGCSMTLGAHNRCINWIQHAHATVLQKPLANLKQGLLAAQTPKTPVEGEAAPHIIAFAQELGNQLLQVQAHMVKFCQRFDAVQENNTTRNEMHRSISSLSQ
jgi:hypothetical protein